MPLTLTDQILFAIVTVIACASVVYGVVVLWETRPWKRDAKGEVDETETMINDSLGFQLRVTMVVKEFEDSITRGQHRTYECDGKVQDGQDHYIELRRGLMGAERSEVIAHEVYHVFYSVRHLITVDEETEALIFGQLVKHAHVFYEKWN